MITRLKRLLRRQPEVADPPWFNRSARRDAMAKNLEAGGIPPKEAREWADSVYGSPKKNRGRVE